MFDAMIVMTTGMDADERERVTRAMPPGPKPLHLVPLKNGETQDTVESVVRCFMERGIEDRDEQDIVVTPWPLSFFAVFPRSAIDMYITAFKEVMDRRGVFASLTATNSKWTWNYLLEHLAEERTYSLRLEAKARATDSSENHEK